MNDLMERGGSGFRSVGQSDYDYDNDNDNDNDNDSDSDSDNGWAGDG